MRKFSIIYLVFFLGCRHQNAFTKILTKSNKNCHWARKTIDDQGKYSYLNSNVQFSIDGDFIYFISDDEHKKGNGYVMDEAPTTGYTWTFSEKDSTFTIGSGLIYKVIKYSPDTILMEGKGYKGRFALIRILESGTVKKESN